MERVAPKLRILLNADAKDWRTNLEEVSRPRDAGLTVKKRKEPEYRTRHKYLLGFRV